MVDAQRPLLLVTQHGQALAWMPFMTIGDTPAAVVEISIAILEAHVGLHVHVRRMGRFPSYRAHTGAVYERSNMHQAAACTSWHFSACGGH